MIDTLLLVKGKTSSSKFCKQNAIVQKLQEPHPHKKPSKEKSKFPIVRDYFIIKAKQNEFNFKSKPFLHHRSSTTHCINAAFAPPFADNSLHQRRFCTTVQLDMASSLVSQYSFAGRDPGEQINCQSGRSYTVVESISYGGYGAVYKVKADWRKGGLFAMKEERRNPRRNHFKLVMEIRVLEAAKGVSKEQQKHFPILYDRSVEVRSFMFIVMSLLGESLADIKYRQSNKIFSMNTGLYCALETLEAIKDMHALGFVHRDIKPANFVLGLAKTGSQNVVYVVDFGIARKIVGADGTVAIPRSKVRFKGTIRFAPLAMHRSEESGRKDDCESWLYMLADMINKKKLPWYEEENLNNVREMKEGVFANPSTLFPGQEFSEFRHIMSYLTKRHYVDKLDYDWLREMVRRVAKRRRCSLHPAFDWSS